LSSVRSSDRGSRAWLRTTAQIDRSNALSTTVVLRIRFAFSRDKKRLCCLSPRAVWLLFSDEDIIGGGTSTVSKPSVNHTSLDEA